MQPMKSHVEEFRLGKARFFLIVRNSEDPLVKIAQPTIITGRKWGAKFAVDTAKSSLKMKDEIGSVTSGKARINLHPHGGWSKETTKNKRRMVSEEIHHFKESRRFAIAVVQPK